MGPWVSAAAVTVRAPAKVNLRLEVGGAQPDGYHALATVFHAVSLFDEVTAVAVGPAEDPGVQVQVTVTGAGAAQVPLDGSNLAVRAALLLAEVAGVTDPVRLHIRKGIPVAGGMAGGSADAAERALRAAGIDPRTRGEQLGVGQFAVLADALADQLQWGRG